MKKLRLWAMLLPGLGAFSVIAAFLPGKRSAGQQPVILENHQPVAVECINQANQHFAYRTNCTPSPNRRCIRTECPGGEVIQNVFPVKIRCVKNNVVVAFGNDCVTHTNAVCVRNPCPPIP